MTLILCRRNMAVIIAALVQTKALPAQAAPYGKCDIVGNSFAIRQCLGNEIASLEKRVFALTMAARPIVAERTDGGTALMDFDAETRAWKAYSNKSCAYWSTGRFGSAGRINELACRRRDMLARIEALTDIINWPS